MEIRGEKKKNNAKSKLLRMEHFSQLKVHVMEFRQHIQLQNDLLSYYGSYLPYTQFPSLSPPQSTASTSFVPTLPKIPRFSRTIHYTT